MTLVFNVLKWIFGIISVPLSILLILYAGLKKEDWTIIDLDGVVLVDKTMGITLIVVWAVIGALFLLFEYLYKRSVKNKSK